MCIALNTMLADQQTHDARGKFTPVFRQLLTAKALTPSQTGAPCLLSKKVAADINELAHAHQEHLDALPRHDTYSRHIIGTDDDWIGFICRWEKNTTSSIHGHPSFAYYQVLNGSIAMDLFEPINENEARQTSTTIMHSGDSIFSITPEGQFDNLIHRVRTGNSLVFTLHLYSDDPSKGRIFKATKTEQT